MTVESDVSDVSPTTVLFYAPTTCEPLPSSIYQSEPYSVIHGATGGLYATFMFMGVDGDLSLVHNVAGDLCRKGRVPELSKQEIGRLISSGNVSLSNVTRTAGLRMGLALGLDRRNGGSQNVDQMISVCQRRDTKDALRGSYMSRKGDFRLMDAMNVVYPELHPVYIELLAVAFRRGHYRDVPEEVLSTRYSYLKSLLERGLKGSTLVSSKLLLDFVDGAKSRNLGDFCLETPVIVSDQEVIRFEKELLRLGGTVTADESLGHRSWLTYASGKFIPESAFDPDNSAQEFQSNSTVVQNLIDTLYENECWGLLDLVNRVIYDAYNFYNKPNSRGSYRSQSDIFPKIVRVCDVTLSDGGSLTFSDLPALLDSYARGLARR